MFYALLNFLKLILFYFMDDGMVQNALLTGYLIGAFCLMSAWPSCASKGYFIYLFWFVYLLLGMTERVHACLNFKKKGLLKWRWTENRCDMNWSI